MVVGDCRAEWDASGAAHINVVIPPDEYAVGVNDSVYTNVAAATVLDAATTAASLMGRRPDPAWARVARALVVLVDEQEGIHPEYQGYQGQVSHSPRGRSRTGAGPLTHHVVELSSWRHPPEAERVCDILAGDQAGGRGVAGLPLGLQHERRAAGQRPALLRQPHRPVGARRDLGRTRHRLP
jgi:hypothetical protein